MKDFDAEQAERERHDEDYAFTLRGETFYRRRRVSLKEARDADTILASDEDSYAAMIRQTLTYIEDRDDAHARLRAMTERDENCTVTDAQNRPNPFTRGFHAKSE